MKIMASDLSFSSEHQLEQMDVSIQEKSLTTRSSINQRRQSLSRELPMRLVDRVSISREENTIFQSNYKTSVSSKSLVTSDAPDAFKAFNESENPISYEQQYAMENFVGRIIDRDVVIKNIQRGEDVVLRDGDTIQPQSSESSNIGSLSGSQSWEMSLKRADINFEEEHLSVASRGQVTTEDGRTIDFSLDVSFDRTFVSRTEENLLINRWQEAVNLTDPLVVSLDGRSPELSDARFEFDLDSDGLTEQINFVSHGSGFLAFDKNGDQSINDGSELFGPGTGNGFGELAAYDEDENQWIDENDAVFSQLSVWTKDENGEDHLMSLKEAGIGAIALDHASGQFNLTQADNSLKGQIKSSGVFLFEDGNVGAVHQVDLVSHAEELEWLKKGPQKTIFATEVPLELSSVNLMPENEGLILPAAEMVSSEVVSPLNELREKIEKMKEDMGRLYEKFDFFSPEKQRRKNGVRQYQLIQPDTTLFMPGFQRGISFPSSRYF